MSLFVLACGRGTPPRADDGRLGETSEALTAAQQCQAAASGNKVAICHATGSDSNPYVYQHVSVNACTSDLSNDPNDFIPTTGTCPSAPLCAGVTCVAADACHLAGVCNPETGFCSNPPASDGTACDDGSSCTVGDACAAGACVGIARPDGSACVNPGDAAAGITGDMCEEGLCVGLAPQGAYAIWATQGIAVGAGAVVVGGDLGVSSATGAVELGAGADVRGSRLVAPFASIDADALVGQIDTGTRATFLTCESFPHVDPPGCALVYRRTSGAPTQAPALPFLLPVQPGTSDVRVHPNGVAALGAGAYGAVTVEKNATLTLSGGSYDVASLALEDGAKVLVEQPSALRIAGALSTGTNSAIQPDPALALAVNLQIDVLGQDTASATPPPGQPDFVPAVRVASGSLVAAVVSAPNGTIDVGGSSTVLGGLLGVVVRIGPGSGVVGFRTILHTSLTDNGCAYLICAFPIACGPSIHCNWPPCELVPAYTGAPCPIPFGQGACQANGECGVVECMPPFEICGGACVDFAVDSLNCGTCGHACPVQVPLPGITSCCNSQCENILGDASNCLVCGTVCPAVANGMATCALGDCGFSCNSGFTACNGECVDLLTDKNNCGACGNVCSSCNGGKCGSCATLAPPEVLNPVTKTCVDPASDCGGAVCGAGECCIDVSTSPTCGACGAVYSPESLTPGAWMMPPALSGYAATGNTLITLTATNHSTNAVEVVGSAMSDMNPTFPGWYHWNVPAPALKLDHWAPQTVKVGSSVLVPNGLPISLGRLAITATADSSAFDTFTPTAESLWPTMHDPGSVEPFSDGNAVVLFDNDGVGVAPPSGSTWSTGWSPVTQGTLPLTAIPGCTSATCTDVTVEVGSYMVDGLKIYGVVCSPPSPSGKTMIVNHGAFGPIDEGAVTDFCGSYAAAGWIVAMSVYRGESLCDDLGVPGGACAGPLNLPGVGPLPGVLKSGGVPELCLGEVTDVLRLTTLVSTRPMVDVSNMLMWGYSHGGCITARAIEAGAHVKAAAVIEGPIDTAAWYDYCDETAHPASLCAMSPMPAFFGASVATTLAVAFGQAGPPLLPLTPNESRIPYDWRSPLTFAGDLKARGKYPSTDLKVLVLQGNSDALIEPSQGCALAATDAASFTSFHISSNACWQASDCLSGLCSPTGTCQCFSNADCSGGTHCDLVNTPHTCLCNTSADCGGGWACVDQRCIVSSTLAPAGLDTSLPNVVGCSQFNQLAWSSGPLPLGAWPNYRYLVAVDGANHGSIILDYPQGVRSPGRPLFDDWVKTLFP